ncbi:MAG: S1 RNA-binding domain-containing protein [Planctomycetota bacterium]|nr:S1 RNA-binding domain-containing protein [Planctomycetota bacterium]MDA1163105.1 S1 RNA-binding domain-containing protein [Planctomycetota bacterium]
MSSDEIVKQDVVTDEATSATPIAEVAIETAAATSDATETSVSVVEDSAEPQSAELSAAEEVQPAVAETEVTTGESVAESSAAESIPVAEEEPAPEQPASGEPAAKRVQLKPTGGEELKAVPTQADVAAAAASIVPDAAGESSVAAPPTPRDAAPPVEIPAEVELGDLEAEIEAAINAETQQAITVEDDKVSQELPETGARLEGVIQSIHGDDVFVDLGCRIPGLLQLRQFEGIGPPEIGSRIKLTVSNVDENEGLITVNLKGGRAKPGGNWDAVEKDQIVDCIVTGTNKGGLEVKVGSLRGFLPAGQVDLQFVGELDSYIGQKLDVKVIEANPKKRNLVVSRRALLIEARREIEKDFWATLEVDQEFEGRVKTLKDYGAFVDLGGADGFLHIGQIAWTHIKHPNEVLSEGQEINVKIIKIEAEKKKISLTMKGMMPNPWDSASGRYTPETVITGNVTRVTEFGAFIELEPGIEGLVHISELDYKRVGKVTDVVRVGQEVSAKVLEFDKNRKRVSLSLKALRQDPQIAEDAATEAELAKLNANRIPREQLKGGISKPSSGGGGLFGNPGDFG